MGEFPEFVWRASGGRFGPYPYQARLAEEGLPALLRVPTGAGKTVAAVLPWLWRLLEHPDEAVRAGTPHRLVYVLPLRSLVEQTAREVEGWRDRLGLVEQVGLVVLMGGHEQDDDAWRLHPAAPAIVVGTQDMVLSRLLMRGYAEPRPSWPVSFGLLHTSTQFVLDETQLMGPAVRTSAQLQGLRDAVGTAAGTATMWMSATLDTAEVRTPDHPEPGASVELDEADSDALRPRLEATRTLRQLDLPRDPKSYPKALAGALTAAHLPGTRTIAVCNTVERAVAVYSALHEAVGEGGPRLVLLHSRFRPAERGRHTDRALGDPPPEGVIVVATQVLEAGVDVTSRVLFTEAAPWSSVVQRAGRCNRGGEYPHADLLWAPPPTGPAPYQASDVAATAQALEALERRAVTSTQLQRHRVDESRPDYPILRRRDLLQLFDTMPDISGADIDVSPWVRDGDDTGVFVAWRRWEDGRPAEREPWPSRRELCPAPLGGVREVVTRADSAGTTLALWAFDQVEGNWQRALATHVRPGAVLLADATRGGYLPELGWAPASRTPVEPAADGTAPGDAVGSDAGTFQEKGGWVTLAAHLADVEEDVRALTGTFGGRLDGLGKTHLEAAARAGLYHDLGKAHPVFQHTLRSNAPEDPGQGPWAKSSSPGGRHERRYFRHELASALALLHPDCRLLQGADEPDLVAYLAAAHHGKVRVAVRSMPGEAHEDPPRILGVAAGDELPAVTLDGGLAVPPLALDPEVLFLGGGDGGRSWAQRALALRDRPDLGPFRLAFLEALVRVADWRVSAAYRKGGDEQAGAAS